MNVPEIDRPKNKSPTAESPNRSVPNKKTMTNTHQPDTHRTVALYALLGLASLYTMYFAKSLLVPIMVASLFALLLSPLVRLLKRFYIPRTLSAFLLLAAIGGPFTLLGIGLVEPAQKWIARLPELSAQMTEGLDSIADSVTAQPAPPPEERGFFGRLFGDNNLPEEKPDDPNALSKRVMQGSMEVMVSMLGATPLIIAQFLIFIILVLFLLIFGPRLYSKIIDILPRVKDKQRATVLVEKIQYELSRYILTVSIINSGLGFVTAVVLWSMGVDDAVLWGALVGLLNFAPYVGPLIGFCVLSIAGAVQYGLVWAALMPAAIYFSINLIEAQFVTPMVLGHNMRLNPLILIVWLILWGWLWGAVGVLLAVPLLVCLKLAAAQLNILPSWVMLIETKA